MASSPAQTTSPQEQTFYDWMRNKGAVVAPFVGLSDFKGMGRGAVALEDIQPDTLLFSLPRSILLTTSTSSLSSRLPSISSLDGWSPLILSMMYECLRTTEWKPYFDLLPKSFDSLMFWSESELKELKGSMVLTKIGKEDADRAYHDDVVPLVSENEAIFGKKEDYTLELFHRCGSWILSRSFHVESGAKDDKEQSSDAEDDDEDEEEEREDVGDVAMVPMADLLNARYGCDNARLFYEPASLNMMSTSFIPKGSQIFNTYADPPNSDLLRRYGHVDDENGSDLVEIGLETVVDLVGGIGGADLSEEKREERAEWLLEMGIDDTFILDKSTELPEELVSAIRTFLLSPEDFAKAQRKESPPKPRMDQISAEWSIKILEAREAEYETSIEEDETLLAQSDLPHRQRMAVVVRLGEKRLLRDTKQGILDFIKPESEEESTKSKKKSGERKRKPDEASGETKKGKKTKSVA